MQTNTGQPDGTCAPSFKYTDPDSNFWYGYAMDDYYNVDFDTSLTTDDMLDVNGDLTLGYYVFDQNVFWTLEPDVPN